MLLDLIKHKRPLWFSSFFSAQRVDSLAALSVLLITAMHPSVSAYGKELGISDLFFPIRTLITWTAEDVLITQDGTETITTAHFTACRWKCTDTLADFYILGVELLIRFELVDAKADDVLLLFCYHKRGRQRIWHASTWHLASFQKVCFFLLDCTRLQGSHVSFLKCRLVQYSW